jgi:4'-phosphopantetheinyl transferase
MVKAIFRSGFVSAGWVSGGEVGWRSAGGAAAGAPGAGEVHVWLAELGRGSSGGPGDAALLGGDELRRADAFAFPELRRVWVWGRATLRRILSVHLGVDPGAVVFAYGEHGKPEVDPAGGLAFNLSHSGRRLVVGVARGSGTAIGVDVERVSRCVEPVAMAERFFAAGEAARVRGLPAEGRALAFAGLWSGKEAYVKALGTGLSTPLSGCEVGGELVAPAMVRTAAGDRRGPGEWVLAQRRLDDDYVCSVAVAVAVAAAGGRVRLVERTVELPLERG